MASTMQEEVKSVEMIPEGSTKEKEETYSKYTKRMEDELLFWPIYTST